jgi:glycosyltransferase involved in cell wall biosynthesis
MTDLVSEIARRPRTVRDRFAVAMGAITPQPGTPIWQALRALFRALPLSDRTRSHWLAEVARYRAAGRQTPFTSGESAVRASQPWPVGEPLLSVVIPCFNYGHYVADAVGSVLGQTWRDIEILVVDGGSTSQDSLRALRALQTPRTRVFFRQARHMVGDNRNFGIRHARGKYICCLDADDLLQPTYLEKALFLLETQGYDVVSTAIGSFGQDRRTYTLERYPTLDDMLVANQVATCAVFPKTLWERAGGFQDCGLGADYVYEDWRLWIRFAALGARIANLVDEPLLRYRVHDRGLTSQAPAMDRHREAVRALNADVIDDLAFARSRANARLQVRVTEPLINFAGRGERERGATLMLALPLSHAQGARRTLGPVLEALAARGYRLIVLSASLRDLDAADHMWLAELTPEIYDLPRFLSPELWRQFFFYLLGVKQVDALWIAGSAFAYELLPDLKSAFPAIKTADLLGEAWGQTLADPPNRCLVDLKLGESGESDASAFERALAGLVAGSAPPSLARARGTA